MSRLLYRCGCWMVWLGLAIAPIQKASAFALEGPAEAWQSTTLGYWKFTFVTLPASGWTTTADDFAWHPHNLGEGFRWNNPVLYYSFDQSFLDYFGSNGVAAVDAAMAVFNKLTNVSAYSADLHEVPIEESRINYTASALHLFDLKSTVMEMMIERLGLIDPERWTWCIRARILPPGLACPRFDFSVIQRNFDPITWEPSRYVNGNLFTYEIQQTCPPPYDFGDAVEFLVDPSGVTFSALATPKLMLPDATFYGWFHTGLTRDDIGGLRYLYATNNMNIEGAGTNTVTFVTDTNTTQLLFTSNLTTLAAQALTNNPAALQALYPTLSIASTTPIYTNIYVTNITAYFTNYPFDPVGAPQHLAFVTNRTLTVQTWFHHTFNNMVTFQLVNGVWTAVPLPDIVSHTGRAWITVQTTVVTNSPFSSVGSPPITNTTTFTYLTNQVAGEYFIVPTNLCGVDIIALQATLINYDTNVVASATNTPTTGATNSQSFTQVVITYFTNHVYLMNPILCLPNTIALRQGIEKVTFIRRDFDSLLGQFFSPVTNNYTLTAITNNRPIPQRVQRVVAQPDILFSAADLAGAFPSLPTVNRPTPSFDLTGQQPNLVGPGNIRGPVTFQFNKVGPIYVNGTYPLFVDEAGALLDFAWASYDGTTNAPIIYPKWASIANLENQVLIQISPPYLPDGTNGMAYRAQLQTSGATPNWTAPFTWSLAPASPGLPPGLSVSASGLISGTPVQAGFYNFVIQATDAVGRTAQQSYVINVLKHL